MILSNWLSSLTIIVIYWGFAGSLGHTLFHLQTNKVQKIHLTWVIASSLGFGLQTLALPFPLFFQIAIILIAVLVLFLFAQQPANFPTWIWSFRLGMRYICFAMLLAIIWSLTQLPLLLASSISISALIAGLYAWQRSLEFN